MVVVNLLFASDDFNPGKPDADGGTPLWWTSYNGYEVVVKLLLVRDSVNPDKLDQYGRILIWWAFINGHEGVAGLLLAQHDINSIKPTTTVKHGFGGLLAVGMRR